MGLSIVRGHVWGNAVCLCPIKRTPGLYELKGPTKVTDPQMQHILSEKRISTAILPLSLNRGEYLSVGGILNVL